MTEIQKADPRARRRSLLIALPGALIGALLLWLVVRFKPQMQTLFVENADTLIGHPLMVGGVMLLLMSPVIGIAVYFWFLGQRIVTARRFPPPGTEVTRDTVVLRDSTAVNRGRAMQMTALVLVVASLTLCAMTAYIMGIGLA